MFTQVIKKYWEECYATDGNVPAGAWRAIEIRDAGVQSLAVVTGLSREYFEAIR